MDMHDRIARRQTAGRNGGIVIDREQLSPVSHGPTLVGRGPVLEQLLDRLDPVFDDGLPDEFAVVGPHGSGTSGIVTNLFSALNDRFAGPTRTIGTTTRAGSERSGTWFAYVDGRRVGSPFAFYRTVLSVISPDPVPEGGVGTDALLDRIRTRLDRSDRRAVIAIDHHDEPEALSYEAVAELVEPIGDSVSIVAAGQEPPAEWDSPIVSVPPYRSHELIDVLTDRTSQGLAAGSLDHDAIRTVAEWADGNAHDALAAIFGAAVLAGDGDSIESTHLEEAMADVPDDGVHVDRALALPETRQEVLRHLDEVHSSDRSINDVASEVADRSSLTASTVKRFLYELADRGVLERVPLESDGSGRRPSGVRPRFSMLVFRALSGDNR